MNPQNYHNKNYKLMSNIDTNILTLHSLFDILTLLKKKIKGYHMGKIKSLYQKHTLLFTLLIVFGLLLIVNCRYLFTNGNFILKADDIEYHINRIQGIADSIKGGYFPTFIHPNILNGFGYANTLFYQDLFLLVPALLVLIGCKSVFAYLLFVLAVCLIMCTLFYIFAKKFTQNKWSLVILTILFIFNQYLFMDIFYRGAIGEIVACLFVIVVFLGLYNLKKENFSKPWILLIGMTGVALSHTSSLIMVSIFVLAYVLLNYKTIFKQKNFFIKAISIVTIFILLILYFYAPMLEQMSSDSFGVNDPWAVPSEKSYNIIQIIYRRYGIGIFTLLIIMLRFFIKKTDENKDRIKLIDRGIIFTVAIIFISSALFPWKYLDKYLYMLQFPWRFFILTICTTPLLIFAILQEFFKDTKRFQKVVYVFIGVLCVYNCLVLNHYKYTQPSYKDVGAAEWIPQGENGVTLEQQIEYYMSHTTLTNQNGDNIDFSRKKNTVRIEFSNSSNDEYYILPLIYYKGYSATLIEEDGTKHTLDIGRDDYACIKVNNNQGINGTIIVDYTGTSIQKVSYLISGSTAILLLVGTPIYIGIMKKRKKRERIDSDNQPQKTA